MALHTTLVSFMEPLCSMKPFNFDFWILRLQWIQRKKWYDALNFQMSNIYLYIYISIYLSIYLSVYLYLYIYINIPVVPGQAGGGSFHPINKTETYKNTWAYRKNHARALSMTCLLLWSRQRMCSIAIPLTPSKYSVKCVLSLDLQSRFRNEFTSVLLGNVI